MDLRKIRELIALYRLAVKSHEEGLIDDTELAAAKNKIRADLKAEWQS